MGSSSSVKSSLSCLDVAAGPLIRIVGCLPMGGWRTCKGKEREKGRGEEGGQIAVRCQWDMALATSLSLVHHRLTFYDCSTRLASIPNPLQSRTHTQPRYYSSNSSSRSVVYRVETLRDPPLQSGGCDVLYTSTLGVVRHFRPARPHINCLSSLRI